MCEVRPVMMTDGVCVFKVFAENLTFSLQRLLSLPCPSSISI